jgi:CTP:molybdopterin cytidylyltransferase MocA
MLQHVVDAMLAVPALDPILVVLGAHEELVRARVDFAFAEAVSCPAWAEGQSASLRCGVHALGDVEAAVVVLGDQPFVTPQAIAGALDWDPERHDAVRAVYDGVPGHPVLLGRRLLRRVDELRGDAGFRDLFEAARVRRFECGHLCDPTDIDTPEELEVRR